MKLVHAIDPNQFIVHLFFHPFQGFALVPPAVDNDEGFVGVLFFDVFDQIGKLFIDRSGGLLPFGFNDQRVGIFGGRIDDKIAGDFPAVDAVAQLKLFGVKGLLERACRDKFVF